jgi:hypothetical protein
VRRAHDVAHALRDRPAPAKRLFGDVGAAVDPDETETQGKVLAFAVERLGAERTDDLRAAGAARPVDDLLAA